LRKEGIFLMASKAAKAPAKSGKTAKLSKPVVKVAAKGAAQSKAKPAKPVVAAKSAKPAPKAAAPKSTPTPKGKVAAPAPAPKGKAVEAAKPVAKAVAAKEAPKKGGKAVEAAKPAAAGKIAAVAIEKPAPVAKASVIAKEGKGGRGKKGVILSPEALSASAALRKVKGQADGVASAALAAHEAAGDQVCREVACEGLATTTGYCRLHYIKNWRKIKRKELILKEGKLNQYIEELVAKYPEKYIDAIKQDLASEKEFSKIIYDLDLDGSVDEFDIEGENDEDIIDDIKREIDDDSEPGGF